MRKFRVHVTYSIDDAIIVEANDAEEALNKVQDRVYTRPSIFAVSGFYSLPWDDANCYEVLSVEDEEVG